MNLKKSRKLKTVIIIILLLITIAVIYHCANKCANWCKPHTPAPICSEDKAYIEGMVDKRIDVDKEPHFKPYFNDSTQEWCVNLRFSVSCYPPPFYCIFF